ncbi:odorant receptor 13a-like [Fopius arisanus]|uniref:Odorant receptor n=1 Tax=Fopius arisanus TaxID=64838 RepID=A0A9R1TXI2_9HYME|nr:PREDICTED: odorant receptor 13a-like [Fopius arisanus]
MEALRTDTWSPDTTYALGYYRLLGRSLGIWPLDSARFAPTAKISFVILTQLWMSTTLTKKLLSNGNCGSVTDTVDALSLVFCGFLTVMKVAIPRVHREDFLAVVNSAVNDWSMATTKSRLVMIKYAQMGRLVFVVQMCGAYAVGFPLVFLRLPIFRGLWNDLENETFRELPIGPSCWVSQDQSSYQYWGEFILQSVALFIVCTAYIGCDAYFFGIAMHVCGQFKLLGENLENLETRDDQEKRRKIQGFVRRHNHLLQLVYNFEEMYHVIILAQVGVDTLLICISGIALLMSLDSGDAVLISCLIIRIYLVYVQLFMYSYVGENLSSYAETLAINVYNSPWYDMPQDIIKDIKFIIMRTNYRFNLTAGKLYSMNIENFRTMVTKIASFFSVLRLVFQESP